MVMVRPTLLNKINRMKKQIAKLLKKIGLIDEDALSKRFPRYKFGMGTYGNLTVKNWGINDKLTVGSYTSIAGGVTILLGCDHRSDWVTTYPFNILWGKFENIKGHPTSKGDVVVGNDVWIGEDALILSGVRVSDGAVIGARAVVTKDVPPYGIVVGAPAKLIRYRFNQEIIAKLMEIKWWEWPENKIMKAVPDLLSNDIERFIKNATQDAYQ